MPHTENPDRVKTSVRFPKTLLLALKGAAAKVGLKMNDLVVSAVSDRVAQIESTIYGEPPPPIDDDEDIVVEQQPQEFGDSDIRKTGDGAWLHAIADEVDKGAECSLPRPVMDILGTLQLAVDKWKGAQPRDVPVDPGQRSAQVFDQSSRPRWNLENIVDGHAEVMRAIDRYNGPETTRQEARAYVGRLARVRASWVFDGSLTIEDPDKSRRSEMRVKSGEVLTHLPFDANWQPK